MKQLDELERLSGVPATTLYKIKRGETENPGVETCRKFLPFVKQAGAYVAAPPSAPATASEAPAAAAGRDKPWLPGVVDRRERDLGPAARRRSTDKPQG